MVGAPQLQVPGAIIVLDVVAVMHRLALAQGSPQQLGHHPDVLGDPARLRLGVGVVRIRAADEDIALGVHPATVAPQGPQRLTAPALGGVAMAEATCVMLPGAAGKHAALVLLAVATQERRELLAAGELVEVAGAQTTGAVFVGAVLEATGSLEHVFEHIAWP